LRYIEKTIYQNKMTTIKIIEEKKHFSLTVFFYLLCCFFIAFISLNLALVLTLFILLYTTIVTGIELEGNERRQRSFFSILGYTLHFKWKSLPDVKYITVVRRLRGCVNCSENSNNVEATFNVNFALNSTQRYRKLKSFEEANTALEYALKIGEALNYKVLDYTTPNRKWLR